MVEVKGQVGDGAKVLLTPNEVRHARARYPRVALIVVSGISLSQPPGQGVKADGGKVREINPWVLDDGRLAVVAYEYEPPAPGQQDGTAGDVSGHAGRRTPGKR